MGPNIGSGRPPSHPGQIQSQLSRMERRERGHWDSCQISLPLTLSGPARAQPHYDTGCSLQHEFYAFGENLTEGEILAQKRICSSSQAAISFISIPLADLLF